MRLNGKCAIVTGGGRGIGREIGRRFVAEGASVLLVDIDGDRAAKAASEITVTSATHGGAEACTADLGGPEGVAHLFQTAHKHFDGRLDILINNAGIAHHGAFLDLPLEDWDRVLRNNLTSAFLCAQSAARVMAEQGEGNIVNIGSISGQRGSYGRTAYGVTKAGIHQMTRIMAVELGPRGIIVNAIAPGPIDTGITSFGPDQERRYLERLPIGRFGLAGDIAGVALFLASDDAAYMTGSVVNVDGGFDSAGLIFSYDELTSLKSHVRDPAKSD
jgi:3-oxoacyl-[acyl-carrier protein] reductase